MKVSFICTVLNEEKTIEPFLDSLMAQTRMPEEVVIVDGGSSDGTIGKCQKFKVKSLKSNFKLKIIKGKGLNRSQGRNLAIKNSTGEIIAVSDGGCYLDKKWLEEITKPFDKERKGRINIKIVDVVAGFYLPTGDSALQKILGELTSVALEKVNPDSFLPSSRSIAFRKNAWEKAGGYPEELNYCEDLIFDLRLKNVDIKISFEPKAIVFWPQKENIPRAIKQFFNYAVGDGEAGERGPHYRKLLIRLGILAGLLILGGLGGLSALITVLLVFFCYKALVLTLKLRSASIFLIAIFLLPALNMAVILGFLIGLIKKKL